ncbi:MAG TPA: GlsB/YeaQ/YmgE family stress response membrane protein [Gemmatimonadales bacterium]
MSLIAWIVVGIVGGFIGSLVVSSRGQGLIGDLFLGIIGAVVGGWAFSLFGHSGVTGINLYSILVSAAGAILLLVAYHALRGAPARA